MCIAFYGSIVLAIYLSNYLPFGLGENLFEEIHGIT